MLRSIAFVVAFFLCAVSTPAQAQLHSEWVLSAGGYTCDITLMGQGNPANRQGQIRTLGCPSQLGTAPQRWRYTANGGQIVLMALGTDIAYVDFRTNTTWEGAYLIGNRTGVSLARMPSQTTQRTGTTPGAVARCKVYLNSQNCAQAQDVGPVRTGAIETLGTMNIRFLASITSMKVGQVSGGSCLAVERCRKEPFTENIWCEFKYDDFKTGWVLKEDAQTVYSRDGCG